MLNNTHRALQVVTILGLGFFRFALYSGSASTGIGLEQSPTDLQHNVCNEKHDERRAEKGDGDESNENSGEGRDPR